MSDVKREYLRLRRRGWRAVDAIRAARIHERWRELEGDRVKIDLLPEIDAYDYDLVESEKDRKAIAARIESEGYWIAVAYIRLHDDDEWEEVESIGGFIGDDFDDSGYDVDLKLTALEALDAAYQREADSYADRATYASALP